MTVPASWVPRGTGTTSSSSRTTVSPNARAVDPKPAPTARCSLANNPAGQGCDLYEYEAESGKLTDLSVDTGATGDTKGANVRGVLGISEDGAYVYFSTGGQLLAGEGNTGKADEEKHEANVYAYHAGHLSYVTTITEVEAGAGNDERAETQGSFDSISSADGSGMHYMVSRVSPNGQILLLATKNKLTEYNNIDSRTGKPDPELYEYRFTEGAPTVSCVSCHPSGTQPITSPVRTESFLPARELRRRPRWRASPGTSLQRPVFFDSFIRLCSGTRRHDNGPRVRVASRRRRRMHEHQGCVTLSTRGRSASRPTSRRERKRGKRLHHDAAPLAKQDEDGLRDLYDVRVDGGSIGTPDRTVQHRKAELSGRRDHVPGSNGRDRLEHEHRAAADTGPASLDAARRRCARQDNQPQGQGRQPDGRVLAARSRNPHGVGIGPGDGSPLSHPCRNLQADRHAHIEEQGDAP